MEGFKGAGLAQPPPRRRRQLCICMASDFFFPSLGGIETHIYNLSQCLIQRGFKVVVITHYAKKRYGVRYLSNGLKVYYLPFLPVANNATLPTFFAFFPLIRNILLRERVDIVHGHQSTSTLAHETLMIARALGMQVAYTDHSLFGFDDMACIHLNKVVRFSLHDLDACICVSHTHRENFVLRAGIHPSRVSVISNAVDASTLVPDPAKRPQPPQVRVVVLSRLAYRKGIDLLVTVIPPICKKLPHVNFVIGGDGPKRIILEEMREKHRLQDRVELIGAVSHDKVGALLQSGHIFLNTSLTESFCIAIVEAAACGMLVVSTNVGGIPEVLPPHMVLLCDPDDVQVQRRLAEAVAMVHTVDPFRFHREILQRYSWHDVAARVERVYFSLLFPETKVYPPCSASATLCLCGHSPLGPSEDDPRNAYAETAEGEVCQAETGAVTGDEAKETTESRTWGEEGNSAGNVDERQPTIRRRPPPGSTCVSCSCCCWSSSALHAPSGASLSQISSCSGPSWRAPCCGDPACCWASSLHARAASAPPDTAQPLPADGDAPHEPDSPCQSASSSLRRAGNFIKHVEASAVGAQSAVNCVSSLPCSGFRVHAAIPESRPSSGSCVCLARGECAEAGECRGGLEGDDFSLRSSPCPGSLSSESASQPGPEFEGEAAHFCVCARRTFWRDDARSISLEGEEDVTSSPRVDTRSFYEDSLCACCDKPPLCCGCLELPPSPPPLPSPFLVVQRLRKLYALGPVSGKIFCIVAIITWVYIRVLEFFYPSAEIEEVPAFPCDILLCLAEESGPEESENLANSESASQDQLH